MNWLGLILSVVGVGFFWLLFIRKANEAERQLAQEEADREHQRQAIFRTILAARAQRDNSQM